MMVTGSAGPIRRRRMPSEMLGTPAVEVNTFSRRRPSASAHTAGLFESTSPGSANGLANSSSTRGRSGSAGGSCARTAAGSSAICSTSVPAVSHGARAVIRVLVSMDFPPVTRRSPPSAT